MPVQISGYKVRLAFTRYIHFILQLFGLLLLLFLVLDHLLFHSVVSLSHLEKYLYLIVAAVASLSLLAGFWAGTSSGRHLVTKWMHIIENEVDHLPKNDRYRFLGLLVLLTAYAVVFVAFLDSKYAVIHLDASRYFNDTRGYIESSSYSLSDIRFWSGSRPFTLPLFYKMIGYDFSNYIQQDAMERVGQYQVAISIFSWTLLAVVFSMGIKRRFLKILAFSIILFLGASLFITQWDRSMLSESLSTSLMVMLLGFLIIVGLLWDRRQKISTGILIILLILILLTAVLYAFTRDTNAYMLVAFSGLMVIGLFSSRVRKHPVLRAYLAILTGFMVIFLLVNVTTNVGKRSISSLFHVVVFRVIPQQERLDYFIAHGMPYDESYDSLQSLGLKQLDQAVISEKLVQQLYGWVNDHGQSVIISYLLSHPAYTLGAPFGDVQHWANSENNGYRKILVPTSTRIRILSTIMYPLWDWLPGLFLVLFLVCIGMIWKGRQSGLLWFLVFTLFFSAYPLVLLIWHSDTNDLERHAFQISVQLRLASWMLIVMLIDRGSIYIRERRIHSSAGKNLKD